MRWVGNWSRRRELNLQPPVYKTGALPLSYAGIKVDSRRGIDVWLIGKKNVHAVNPGEQVSWVGGSPGTRTPNQLIKSQLLYH